MYIEVKQKQFDFEELNDCSLAVTFKPFSSRKIKTSYFVLFRPKTRYHELAVKVLRNDANWVELNYFGEMCHDFNNEVIGSI